MWHEAWPTWQREDSSIAISPLETAWSEEWEEEEREEEEMEEEEPEESSSRSPISA